MPFDRHRMWRVLVDALERMPDGVLEERADWVQLRTPSSSHPGHNAVMHAELGDDEADARIDAVVAEHLARGSGLRWVVDEGSRPADLAARLEARGLQLLGRGMGMIRGVDPPPYPEPPAGGRIVQATADDCDRIGESTSAGWQRPPGFGHTAAAWARRAFASGKDDLLFWLAYDGDELVGSCTLRVLPGVGYLQGACVLPRARGRGFYRALTWARIAELHRRGIERVVIWADPTTSGPVALAMGFQPVAEAAFYEIRAPGT